MMYLSKNFNGIDIIWSDYSMAAVFDKEELAHEAVILSGGVVVRDASGQYLLRQL